MENIYHGIWTPWAATLCHGCHGDQGPVRVTLDKLLPMQEKPESHCKCDGCGQRIYCGDEVTLLASLRDTLREAGIKSAMHQTGGMCAALHIPLDEFHDGPYLSCFICWPGEEGWQYGLYRYKGADDEFPDMWATSKGDRASALEAITKLVKESK
jgi:hypothetical protein